MKPGFAIINVGRETHVFLRGKDISEGILDLHYHTKDKYDNLSPTVEMTVNVESFSFDDGCTIEEFLQKTKELDEAFAEGDRKRAARKQREVGVNPFNIQMKIDGKSLM